MATQWWSVQHFAAAVVLIGTVGSLCFVFVATSVPAETDLKSQRKKKVEEYVVTLKKKGFKGADEVIVLAMLSCFDWVFFCSTENNFLFFNFISFKEIVRWNDFKYIKNAVVAINFFLWVAVSLACYFQRIYLFSFLS